MKRHIVCVTPYFPPHTGGTENVAFQIASRIHRSGYSVEVLTSNINAPKNKRLIKQFPITYLKSFSIANTPLSFGLLIALWRIPKHSIIHLHAVQAFYPEAVGLIACIRKIPYIAHFHMDLDTSGIMGFLLYPYKRYIYKNVLKRARKILCVNDKQKLFLQRFYQINETNITVIPNGIDDIFFTPHLPVHNKKLKILTVGRLSKQKNIYRLIEVILRIQIPYELMIVGDGEEKEELLELIHRFSLQQVNLLGKKEDRELFELYASSDIFILTSNKEGLPLVIIEAMAMGLPIIATRNDGTESLLEDIGILVSPDANEISEQLEILMQDSKRRKKLSYLAKKKAEAYQWQKIIPSIIKIYKEVSYE